MKTKKKFLIYWDYRRSDLLVPFNKLSDEFEWNFIFFRSKEDDNTQLPYRRFYWADFKTPYELLTDVGPDGIIYSDLSSLYAVSMNIAAKNKNIPTYLLDHGIKLDYFFYLDIEKNLKLLNKKVQKTKLNVRPFKVDKFHTVRFYFASLKFKNLAQSIKIFKLFFASLSSNNATAFPKIKFPLRCPNKYLLFSKQNFVYYKQRDGIDESEIIYFGNPHQDDYVLQLSKAVKDTSDPYYLLLDDGQIEGFGITPTQKNNFICKLNEFALSQKSRLVVKLHPFDYDRTDLYQHDNILYKTTADISKLITAATGCFAISTTLMLPLIIAGKLVAFKVPNLKIQEVIESYGVKFLDYLNFSLSEIDFTTTIIPGPQSANFIEHFLYKDDGKANERLRTILRL